MYVNKTRKQARLVLSTLLMTLVLSPLGQARSIESELDVLFAGYTDQTPGVAVAIIENGEVIFSKGYGLANLEYDIPITSRTVFNVGSVSKQFTAFSVYLLAERGKLSLKDDIRLYLPEMPDYGKPISIEHLLFHTSGLKEPLALLSFAGWRMDDYISMQHVLSLISRQTSLNFPSGSEFRYSNANYVLLAEIVERVSGQTFNHFTRDNIFKPLGMIHSQFFDDNEKLIPQRAYSYDFEENEYKKERLNAAYYGSTALYTTVDDLVKWHSNFRSPKVGTRALLDKFNAPATLDDGSPAFLDAELNIQHAKGQFRRNYRGLETFIHTGGDAYFRSFSGRFPDEDLSIILLSNSPHFVAFPMGIKVLETYAGDRLTPAIPATSNPPPSNQDAPAVRQSDFRKFEGRYVSDELRSSFDFIQQQGQLILRHNRLADIQLTASPEPTEFSGRNYYPFTARFRKNTDGQVIELEIVDFRGEQLLFEKVK